MALIYNTLDNVVKPGVTFRADSACGQYRSRVIREHRELGYWETTIISGGHPALLNSIQVVRASDIYKARTGVDAYLAGTPYLNTGS